MQIAKQVLFWVTVVLGGIGLVMGVEWLSVVPLAIFCVLAGREIWGHMNHQVAILVLALIMIGVNLVNYSGVDVVLWTAILICWAIGKTEQKRYN